MACGDPKAAARVAILDPRLTVSQPPRVTARSGIDSIAHAVETAVTKGRTPLSLLFSREAFRLTMAGLPQVLKSPDNLEARGHMLLGAALGGMAIENSMLGAAHSAANPLTAHFGIAHGEAVGVMLPHVVRFNSDDAVVAQAYSELASIGQIARPTETPKENAERLVKRLQQLLALTGLPYSLSHHGVTAKDIPLLAEEAAKQWTAQFNPVTVTAADFERIYAGALAS
jgi:alcohol dehydrogenase